MEWNRKNPKVPVWIKELQRGIKKDLNRTETIDVDFKYTEEGKKVKAHRVTQRITQRYINGMVRTNTGDTWVLKNRTAIA